MYARIRTFPTLVSPFLESARRFPAYGGVTAPENDADGVHCSHMAMVRFRHECARVPLLLALKSMPIALNTVI